MYRWQAHLIGLVVAGTVSGCGGGGSVEPGSGAATPTNEARLGQSERDMAALRESDLLVEIDPQACEARVEPRLWAGTEQTVRKRMGLSMQQYCDARGTSGTLTVYDSRTGQELDSAASLGL